MKISSPKDRFLLKVQQTDTCWTWMGALAAGYGSFMLHGRQIPAHRAALILFRDMSLPHGHTMHVDHRCGNTRCVNPDHLELITAAENILRRDLARFGSRYRTVCKHGHAMTPENTYVGPRGDRRICIACRDETSRRRRQRGAQRCA